MIPRIYLKSYEWYFDYLSILSSSPAHLISFLVTLTYLIYPLSLLKFLFCKNCPTSHILKYFAIFRFNFSSMLFCVEIDVSWIGDLLTILYFLENYLLAVGVLALLLSFILWYLEEIFYKDILAKGCLVFGVWIFCKISKAFLIKEIFIF